MDEDLYALENSQKRIDEITEATIEFYKVIITCRTQFFSDENSEPREIPFIKYGNNDKNLKFYKIYISNFTNNDIDKFLNKKYKWKRNKKYKAKRIIEKSPDLMARPMLLAYIDDLLDKNDETLCITDIYSVLIKKWLDREPVEFELLKNFIYNVVVYMFSSNLRFLQQDNILQLCKREEIEIINPILARTRSLLVRNGLGEYKFAHYSIYEYLISYIAIYKDDSIREKILKMDKSFNRKYFRELSYKQLLSGNRNLKFLDFSGVLLEGIDLSDADLSNTNFEKAVLKNVCLNGANLKKSNLKEAKFYQVQLKKADLAESCLIEADLQEASLRECKLNKADLTRANLKLADLQEADLRESKLNETNLIDANIQGIEIDQVGLQYVLDNYEEIMFGLKYTAIDKNLEE